MGSKSRKCLPFFIEYVRAHTGIFKARVSIGIYRHGVLRLRRYLGLSQVTLQSNAGLEDHIKNEN